MFAPDMRLDPGQRVGAYEIVGSLGAGGMGEVSQARDTRALEWLEQAIRAGYPLRRIGRSPWLKDLRTDERYTRLRQ